MSLKQNPVEQSSGVVATYQPLLRPCDDPKANFDRIKNHDLWWERDARIATRDRLKNYLLTK